MTICPLTYQKCESDYSDAGLKSLSPRLKALAALPFTAAEQIREAAARAPKMSVQGVQPKLSAQLNVSKGRFEKVRDSVLDDIKSALPEWERLIKRCFLSAKLKQKYHQLLDCRWAILF